MGYVDAQAGDADRTAFRRTEKRYKLYKHSSTSIRSSRLREMVPPTDLSQVLDFRKVKRLASHGSICKNGIVRVENKYDWPVFTMEDHPGFYFIPEAVTVEEQMHWIRESLTTFPQPPNRTNHTAFYGHIYDLWNRAQNEEMLESRSDTNTSQGTGVLSHEKDFFSTADLEELDERLLASVRLTSAEDAVQDALGSSSTSDGKHSRSCERLRCKRLVNEKDLAKTRVSSKTLLYKLRWATLGLQFDWSKRAYDTSLPYREIPPRLSEFASKLAKPAMNGDDFHAEAAIVNYFRCDDMLGGHLDDMEADWSKPIVSISFGCKAIFLLGGRSREENPTAMFLRSGDVVLMAGAARGCFHGVPRIFVDPDESDLPDFDGFDLSFAPFIDYMRTSRINLNIRQVF